MSMSSNVYLNNLKTVEKVTEKQIKDLKNMPATEHITERKAKGLA